MWQAPNQRVRALNQAKKREKERLRRPLHLKRAQAELKILASGIGKPATIAMARVLLNDLTPQGVGLFSPIALREGQEIQITIEEPKRFFVRARILWCQEYDTDRNVISQEPYSFRVAVEFIYATADEERAVRDFCAELAREHLYAA